MATLRESFFLHEETDLSALATTTRISPPAFDTRIIFPVLCLSSVFIFAVLRLFDRLFHPSIKPRALLHLETTSPSLAHRNGGRIALAWGLVRSVGLMGLSSVQIWVLIEQRREAEVKLAEWAELVGYIYISTLSFLSVAFPPSPDAAPSRSLRPVLVSLLFSSFVNYAWRNAGPLYSYKKPSTDAWNPRNLTKLSLLALTSILPVLFSPRIFVPAAVGTVATEEETASVFSFICVAYLDKLVFRAWKKPTSLSLEDLPDLRAAEKAAYVKAHFMHFLDPTDRRSKKNLIRGFIRIWWREIIICELICLGKAFLNYSSIIGTQHLLLYVQVPELATTRPWIWVAMIGLGPLLSSTFFNLFMTLSLRFARQVESLVLQLLFEHSLRLRVTELPAEAVLADGKEKKNLVGKVNSLMSNDVAQAGQIRMVLYYYTELVFGTLISAYLLWNLLRWTAFAAMGFSLLVLPISFKAIKYQRSLQKSFKSLTDVRIQKISEAITGLRITKALGLEERATADINEARTNELKVNRRSQYVALLGRIVTSSLPTFVMIGTLGVYTGIQGGTLDAATIFTAISLLQRFSMNLAQLYQVQQYTIGPTTALERMDEFLRDTPLVDGHSPGAIIPVQEEWIGFKKAAFTWYQDLPADSTLFNFRLEVNDLVFEKGKVTVITGSTGSGKTSLLMALLGEMHFEKEPDAICSLPRSEGVSYVHQQPFIQNRTIRDNVTFGSAFDRERYDQVLSACGLEQDLVLFKAGDLTEVGEKGITLSGGQRARLGLARAIYSSATTVLIDDCFSSLDVQTSRWVVEKCFQSSLAKGRTIILITHHISLVAPIADFLVTLEQGRVVSSGPFARIIAIKNDLIAVNARELEEEGHNGETAVDEEKQELNRAADGRLALEEEKIDGKVGFRIMKTLIASFGDWRFWIPFLLLEIATDMGSTVRAWWFATWSRAYATASAPRDVHTLYFLGVFSTLAFSAIFLIALNSFFWTFGTFRSSRVIHHRLLGSVMACTLRFLDVTPAGRIVGRFTKDIRVVDSSLSQGTNNIVSLPLSMLVQFITILYLVPMFSIIALVVLFLGFIVAQLYLSAQRSVKRMHSNFQSPVFSHFAEAIAGIISIRAFGAESLFREEGVTLLDKYMKAFASMGNLNRWSASRFDLLNAAFSGGLASYLICAPGRDASTVGLIMSVSLGFSGMILYTIQAYNDWEIDLVSLERITGYVEIEHEPARTLEGTPPAAWPRSGSLTVKALSARYTKDGPNVLDDVSFSLPSGTKCAVVGRTGSGKSTLAVSLLRLIPTEGTVTIDGLDISKLNLHAIRSNMTLIPQDPTLFSGTVRSNIDPYGTMDDAALNDILRSIGFVKGLEPHVLTQDAGPTTQKALNLGSTVSAGGENLSQGTRQLVSYARGLVRRSKIYIFDEATASLDYETDALIQRTLRTEMGDCTLITIAHRLLSVIDYDVVLVLSDGKVVEFGSPTVLLSGTQRVTSGRW